jgi:outer membrane receptor protein involved in Fe transport
MRFKNTMHSINVYLENESTLTGLFIVCDQNSGKNHHTNKTERASGASTLPITLQVTDNLTPMNPTSELPLPVYTCSNRVSLLLSIVALSVAATPGWSQTTAETTYERERRDQPVVLDPFVVTSNRDVGFVAASALAGGRMASDLADTPVAYTVQTKEFLETLNLTELNDALEWSVNTYNYTDNESGGVALGGIGLSTTRGVISNAAQRNFFPGTMNFDTYNLERFDYTRGPNSILFGAGTISGTANAMTKFARFRDPLTELRLQVNSNGGIRMAVDTGRNITKHVASRFNFLWDDGRTWRDGEKIKKEGLAAAFTANLTAKTELRVAGEYFHSVNRTFPNMIRDQISAWDGVTTFSGPESLAGSSVAPAYLLRGVTRRGSTATAAAPNADEDWVWAPDGRTLLNYAGSMFTLGYGGPGNRPINGRSAVAGLISVQAQPILDMLGSPLTLDERFGPAESGSDFRIPSRETTNIASKPVATDKYYDATLFLRHKFSDALFMELAGDANKKDSYGDGSYYYNNGSFDGFGPVFLDVNEKLPTGAPNPNFLQPFMQARMDRRLSTTENQSVRLAAAYVKSFSWGELKLNAMSGIETSETLTTRENGVLPVDADARNWARNGGEMRLLHYRLYFNQANRGAPLMEVPLTAIDPLTGLNTTYTPVWALQTYRSEGGVIKQIRDAQYGHLAGHLSLWNKRLIFLGAVRWDDISSQQKMGLRAKDYSVGFSPTAGNYQWRPDAPDDYLTLQYKTRNASGVQTGNFINAATRPMLASGDRNPLYASDRFKDDYSPLTIDARATTKSLGGIVNLGKGYSLWANAAQTFNPGNLALPTIAFEVPPPTFSDGYDVGIRYILPNGKLSLNASWYHSKEKNFNAGSPPGNSAFPVIINANAIGDVNPNGTNTRGLANVPAGWQDKSDRETEGFEFEVVANLTPNWRLTANVGTANAYQMGAFRDTVAWVTENEGTLKQVATDAGLVFDVNGRAALPTDPLAPRGIDTNQGLADAYNTVINILSGFATQEQLVVRLPKYTANLYTDYRFSAGKLKGLRIGAGIRYRGPQNIGNRGADTIPNPALGPVATKDDPTVDQYTPIWTRGYGLVNASVGFPVKLKGGHTVNLNLTIDNLLDYDYPVYNSVGPRPYQGDLTSPARTQVPIAYTYLIPRTYQLSASFSF